jgi:hypothetical protein
MPAVGESKVSFLAFAHRITSWPLRIPAIVSTWIV